MALDLGGGSDIVIRAPYGRVFVSCLERGLCMSSGVLELDFIEELRLRRWARENYVPPEKRSQNWHPIVHEEMEKKELDHDTASPLLASAASYRWSRS